LNLSQSNKDAASVFSVHVCNSPPFTNTAQKIGLHTASTLFYGLGACGMGVTHNMLYGGVRLFGFLNTRGK
jgi:hypothetical protein